MRSPSHTKRGLSFIGVVVSLALLLIFFTGLIAMFRASLALTAAAKARAGATALAAEQMEYVRSLTYADTGTIGGIPNGAVPQEKKEDLNGITYTTRTFIQYIDDPADGQGIDDQTGIITDYKFIKVTTSYEVADRSAEVSLVSNRTPRGIETTEGGGTLRIQVNDALSTPLQSAQVRIQNDLLDPIVDVTTFSNASGLVFLPGAATGTGYRVTVTRSGFSTAQTYDQDAQNVVPDPGHLTVVEGATTQQTFAIDLLSRLRLETYEPVRDGLSEDGFSSSDSLLETNNTVVNGGVLQLTQDASGFAVTGSAQSTSTSPTHLSAWDAVYATSTVPAGTSISYQLYYDANGPVIIPNDALPGNAAGFSSTPIDISGLATSTYDTLYLGATLETNATTTTPQIDAWSIGFQEGPIPLPDVSLDVVGSKVIGENDLGESILKNSFATTTDGFGVRALENIEWDTYAIDVPTYDIVEACRPVPVNLGPDSDETVRLILTPTISDSLRVTVETVAGELIEDAVVEVSREGVAQQGVTSTCGQAYFGDIDGNTGYTVTVSHPSYQTQEVTEVTIAEGSALSVILDPS